MKKRAASKRKRRGKGRSKIMPLAFLRREKLCDGGREKRQPAVVGGRKGDLHYFGGRVALNKRKCSVATGRADCHKRSVF